MGKTIRLIVEDCKRGQNDAQVSRTVLPKNLQEPENKTQQTKKKQKSKKKKLVIFFQKRRRPRLGPALTECMYVENNAIFGILCTGFVYL
jgi:hypothetical protein